MRWLIIFAPVAIATVGAVMAGFWSVGVPFDRASFHAGIAVVFVVKWICALFGEAV